MNDEKIVQLVCEKHSFRACGLGELKELKRAIREAISLSREQKWIPCSERLPEIGVSVLVGREDCPSRTRMARIREHRPYQRGGPWVVNGCFYALEAFTHWMPAPWPPSAPLTEGSTDEVEDRKEE